VLVDDDPAALIQQGGELVQRAGEIRDVVERAVGDDDLKWARFRELLHIEARNPRNPG
jgi:hypothetical protein